MARKKKRLTPEARAEWEARSEKTLRMLQERIDYYERKLGGKTSA